jgi:hypothetical protein
VPLDTKAVSIEFFQTLFETFHRRSTPVFRIVLALAVASALSGLTLRFTNPRPTLAFGVSSTLLVLAVDFAIFAAILHVSCKAFKTLSVSLASVNVGLQTSASLLPESSPAGYKVKGLPTAVRTFLFLVLPATCFWLLPPFPYRLLLLGLLACIGILLWLGNMPRSLYVHPDGIHSSLGKSSKVIAYKDVANVEICQHGNREVRVILKDSSSLMFFGSRRMQSAVVDKLRDYASQSGVDTIGWPHASDFDPPSGAPALLADFMEAAQPYRLPSLLRFLRISAVASIVAFAAFWSLHQALIPSGPPWTILSGLAWPLPAIPAVAVGLAFAKSYGHWRNAQSRTPEELAGLLLLNARAWGNYTESLYRSVWVSADLAAAIVVLAASLLFAPAFLAFNDHDKTLTVRKPFASAESHHLLSEIKSVRRIYCHGCGTAATKLEFKDGTAIIPANFLPTLSPDNDTRLCELAWPFTGKPPQDSPCRRTVH